MDLPPSAAAAATTTTISSHSSSPALHQEIERLVKRFDQTEQLQNLKARLRSLNDKFWDLFAENDDLRRENRALQHRNQALLKMIEELQGPAAEEHPSMDALYLPSSF